MFGPRNWENKDDLTDDDVAAYAQKYIEDLDKEIVQFESEITLLRRSTEALRRERDEAEAAIIDFVDNPRRMEVRADDNRQRKAFRHGAEEENSGHLERREESSYGDDVLSFSDTA